MFLLEFVTIQFFLPPVNDEMIQGIRFRRKVKAPINRLLVPAKTILSRHTSILYLNHFWSIPKLISLNLFVSLDIFGLDSLFYFLLLSTFVEILSILSINIFAQIMNIKIAYFVRYFIANIHTFLKNIYF